MFVILLTSNASICNSFVNLVERVIVNVLVKMKSFERYNGVFAVTATGHFQPRALRTKLWTLTGTAHNAESVFDRQYA